MMTVSKRVKELVEELDAETAVEMIEIFLSHSEQGIDKRLGNLRTSLDNKNSAGLAHEAHILKGSSSNFEATDVMRLSGLLEQQAHQANFNEAKKTLEQLETAVESLRRELINEREKCI